MPVSSDTAVSKAGPADCIYECYSARSIYTQHRDV
jgi:hypothetical protein